MGTCCSFTCPSTFEFPDTAMQSIYIIRIQALIRRHIAKNTRHNHSAHEEKHSHQLIALSSENCKVNVYNNLGNRK